MAAAETARLIASLELQTQKFDAGFGKVASGMDRLDQRFAKSTSFWKHSVSTAFGVGLERVVAAGVRGVFGALNAGIASLQEQGKVVAQTEAVIKSTGGSAHVTAGQIRELSEATEKKTAIDDKQIQTAANLLLTFTNVRNETGKGNDVFNQSVGILADLATAMGTDASSGAIQLGKALNDPVKGITALTRIGVTFDASQKKRIEQFVKEGKVIEAQKIILAELNKEFGGSGAAFAATDAGKAAQFADAVEDIQKAFAVGLLPAITRVRESLTKFLSDPQTMGQVENLGNAIASIFSEGNIRTAANLMTTAAGAIGTAIKLFSGLPKEVQALAVGAIALKKFTGIGITDIAKTIGGELFKRGGTPANPLFVSDVAGGLGGAAGAGGKGALGAISKVFLVGEAIGLALLVNEVRNGIADQSTKQSEALKGTLSDFIANNPSPAALQSALDGVEQGIKDFNSSNLPLFLVQGDALKNLEDMREILRTQLAEARGDRLTGPFGHNGPMPRTLAQVEAGVTAMRHVLHDDLIAAIASIDSESVKLSDAMDAVMKAILGGAGNSAQVQTVIDKLKTRRDLALGAGDKKLAAELSAEIKKLEPFAKGRQWQAEQIDAARKIADSNKSTADKVAALKGIQQDLLSHQRTMAADIVGGLLGVITAVQNIKLPAGSSPNVLPNGFVVPGGVPLPKPTPRGSTLLPGDSRSEGRVIVANVSISTRDVKTAQVIRTRMGATPIEAGSA